MAAERDIKFRQMLYKQNVRVRERNLAERRLLQRKLRQINFGGEKDLTLKDNEIRRIRDDIWRQEGLAEFLATENENLHFPAINKLAKSQERQKSQSPPSEEVFNVMTLPPMGKVQSKSTNALLPQPKAASTQLFQSKSTSALLSESKSTNDTLLSPSSCTFEAKKLSCDNFPCNKMVNYTRIGFNIRCEDTGCNQFTTVKQVYAKSREGLIMDLESQSVRRPMKTSMDQTNRKISALRTIFLGMKKKSEENRPKDWCVNYGKPTSKRKLLKVARPGSIHDLEGL